MAAIAYIFLLAAGLYLLRKALKSNTAFVLLLGLAIVLSFLVTTNAIRIVTCMVIIVVGSLVVLALDRADILA